GNVRWIILKVAVHSDDDRTGGPVDSGLKRGGLTEIAPKSNYLDMRITGSQLFEHGKGPVDAAIVDDDNFVIEGEWVQRLSQPVSKRAKVLPLVFDWDHHGKIHHRIEPPCSRQWSCCWATLPLGSVCLLSCEKNEGTVQRDKK